MNKTEAIRMMLDAKNVMTGEGSDYMYFDFDRERFMWGDGHRCDINNMGTHLSYQEYKPREYFDFMTAVKYMTEGQACCCEDQKGEGYFNRDDFNTDEYYIRAYGQAASSPIILYLSLINSTKWYKKEE